MESAIDIRPAPRNPNARTLLAGGGATAALVAAAVVLFLSVAAFVAFKGLPFGADDPGDTRVALAGGAPQAAATAAAPTADAVAADPATPSPAALAEILAALPPGASAPDIPGLANPLGGPPSTDTPPFPTPGGDPTPIPDGTPASPGALETVVAGIDNTTGNLGLNLPLGGATGGLTDRLDKTLSDTVNGVGGLIGQGDLGDNLTGALNQTTNGLLGPGGVGDRLLDPPR